MIALSQSRAHQETQGPPTLTGCGLRGCRRGCTSHLCKSYAASGTSERRIESSFDERVHRAFADFAFSVREWKQQTPTPLPCTYTADLVVSEGCIGGIHHHDKFHLGIGHVTISARLLRNMLWHHGCMTAYGSQGPASPENLVNPHFGED